MNVIQIRPKRRRLEEETAYLIVGAVAWLFTLATIAIFFETLA